MPPRAAPAGGFAIRPGAARTVHAGKGTGMTTHNRQATAFARLAEVSLRTWLLLALALVAVQAGVLFLFGQPPICMCGHVRLWQGDVLGPENSQQRLDWYTPSHIIHGLAFYLLLRLVFPTAPVALRFAVALGLEVGWELVENSPAIIERYRQQALAQGYFGDSI